MQFEYIFVYIMIDLFCMLFSVVIFSKISIDMGTEREVQALRWFIIMFILFLCADAVWALGEYGYLPVPRAGVGLTEHVTMVLMGAVSYFWFVYAENKLQAPYADSRWFKWVAAVPIGIVVLLFLTSVWTGWTFTLSGEDGYEEGPVSWLPMFVFMVYVVYIAVHALVRLRKETSSARRREDVTLIAFVLFPTACGIVDLLVHGMPVMALSVFTSVLLVFMNSQDARINTDSLTGLNNRRRAVEYVEDSLAGADGSVPFAIFMVDVDYFKRINDTWGHGEGDHALQMIAEGLRRTASGHRALVARWGGDEFLMAAFLDGATSPEDVEGELRRNIDDVCVEEEAAYHVQVSAGHALAAQGDSLPDLVLAADRLLYEQKERHHAESSR